MLVFIALWWPLSHWFYADWYHSLLGFAGYDDGLVKVIGTMGIFPLALLAMTAKNPAASRPYLTIFMIWSVGMIGTYLYLIGTGAFPDHEYLNVGLLVGNFAVMAGLMPSASS